MKRKTEYDDELIGEFEVVEDFLPSPENLVLKEDNVKVTIALSKSSVEFFKRIARKNDTQYQRLIRRVLDLYASWYAREMAEGRVSRAPSQPGASIARERRSSKKR